MPAILKQPREILAHGGIVIDDQDPLAQNRITKRSVPDDSPRGSRRSGTHGGGSGANDRSSRVGVPFQPAERFVQEGLDRLQGKRGARRVHPIRGQVGESPRNAHREAGSGPRVALHLDDAPVQLCQLLGEGQPDAGTFDRAGAGCSDHCKALKDAREILLGNAASGIDDLEIKMIVRGAQPNRHLPLEREFQGIREKVMDDLRPHLGIDVSRLRGGRTIDD